jgi:nucleotide-binding universal stress UspA family protein
LDSTEIVIGVDGSELAERSVPVAQRWARMLDLEPVLVEVLPAGKPIVDSPRAAESAYVRELGRRFPGDRPLGWRVVRALDAADALVEEAKRGRAALVALTSHGRTGVGRVVFGSIVARVVHDSPCPVLVTPSPPG